MLVLSLLLHSSQLRGAGGVLQSVLHRCMCQPQLTLVPQGKQQRKHSGCISEQGSCPVGTPPSVSLCGAENFSLLVKRGIVQKKYTHRA